MTYSLCLCYHLFVVLLLLLVSSLLIKKTVRNEKLVVMKVEFKHQKSNKINQDLLKTFPTSYFCLVNTNPLKGLVMINPATSHTTKPDLIATTKILLDPNTSKIRWAWETFW